MSDVIRSGLDSLAETVAEVKPSFRGGGPRHRAADVAAGIVLIALAAHPPPTSAVVRAVGRAALTVSPSITAATVVTSARVLRRSTTPIFPAHRRLLRTVYPAAARGHLVGGAPRSVIWSVAVLRGVKVFWIGAPKAGSTSRSTSEWAGPRCSSSRPSPRLPSLRGRRLWGTAVPRVRHHRRGALHGGRRRLRHQAANPWPSCVRLPRGVPHPDDPGVRHPRDVSLATYSLRWSARRRVLCHDGNQLAYHRQPSGRLVRPS